MPDESPDTRKPDGGPAFPSQPLGELGYPTMEAHPGMSLRDWFAGQALAGLLANPSIDPVRDFTTAETVAATVFHFADAMLAARESK